MTQPAERCAIKLRDDQAVASFGQHGHGLYAGITKLSCLAFGNAGNLAKVIISNAPVLAAITPVAKVTVLGRLWICLFVHSTYSTHEVFQQPLEICRIVGTQVRLLFAR